MNLDLQFLIESLKTLIETPSPVGYYVEMKPVLEDFAQKLGFEITYDNRDTAYITVPGKCTDKTVCLSTHADTLGFMVRGFNPDGTLRLRPLGGINFSNIEGENVTIHTRGGKRYTGTLVCAHHSVHAFADARTMERNEDTVFVLLDEFVKSPEDVRALGVRHGDYISIDPRFSVTKSGYLKSRFIDNKAAMACSLTILKALKEQNLKPKYNTVFAFSFYEEVGFGGVYVPNEISEYVSVDIAVLGPDADGSEQTVTICAKDMNMPYDYDLTNRLIAAAEQNGCDYAVDLYFRYGSDASQAIKGGNNVKTAAFGMGAHSSHGVERTHIKGVENTVKLMMAYILDK